jgi:hypothetical protein
MKNFEGFFNERWASKVKRKENMNKFSPKDIQ